MTAKEQQICNLMTALNCSRDEALEILKDDAAIDSGQRMEFDLPPEEEKKAKKYANSTEHKTKSNVHHERQPDTEKEAIITQLAQNLAQNESYSVEIVNKNNLIRFKVGKNWYDLKLIKKNMNIFKPNGD